MKESAQGVCNDDMGHNYASTTGNFKAIFFVFSFFWQRKARGEGGLSEPNCN